MPEADAFEAPQGQTFHADPLLQSVTEAFAGNGVLANDDARVTADGATEMAIDVAQADDGIAFGGDTYTPASASFTLSDGPATTTNGEDDARVDLVYFDAGTGSYAVDEGVADPNPVPPSVPDSALMLAIVLVPHGATDISDPNILNWQARPNAAVKSGGTAQGGSNEAAFEQGLQVGADDGDLTESDSPASFTFTAGDGRDIHGQTDVTISNSSGASATEDVTVELYDGTDTTGTLLLDETKSVSVADGGSAAETFITTDKNLDGGDYHISITTSGSDLSIDETVERASGLIYSYIEQDDGTHELINRYTGTAVFSVDPVTDEIAFPNAAIDQAEIADGSITTSKLANDAVTAAKIAANAVTNEQMADEAVGTAEIKALASGVASVTNPGTFGALFDVPVDSNAANGDLQSFTFDVDGNTVIEVRGVADGSGGVDTLEVRAYQTVNVNGNDIVDGPGTTVYSSNDGHVPRPQVDDAIVRASTKTAAYTTADEEMVPVDPSGTGGLTITLASADAAAGNEIIVKDVGGTASTNPITVATEGSETIDNNSSVTIDINHGVLMAVGDGTNWDIEKAPARTVDPRNIFEGTETGAVAAGDQGILTVDNLADGETVEVFKSALTTDTIEAVPSGVDLKLVTFDNAGGFTTRATIITGDGSTIHDRETGNPLTQYTNTTGSAQSIGILVDNASGSSQDVVAKIEGTAPT